MSTYKEIVTKAVVGKGKKVTKGSYTVETEQMPNTVLGCWIINHRFSGLNNDGQVNVNGTFDVNVWYSYDNDSKTAVTTKSLPYQDLMKLGLTDNIGNSQEIIVRSLKQPTVTEVNIKEGLVHLEVEKELGVEVVGETKVKIAVEDDEEPWEVLIDETEVNDQIETVNEEYLD